MLRTSRPTCRGLAAMLLSAVVAVAYAVLAPPALAQPPLALSPDHGPVRTAVTVTATELGPCERAGVAVVIQWDGSDLPVSGESFSGGVYTATIKVPDNAVIRGYQVTAGCSVYSVPYEQTGTFTVEPAPNPNPNPNPN